MSHEMVGGLEINMEMNGLMTGANVYSVDGEKIGKVRRLFSAEPEPARIDVAPQGSPGQDVAVRGDPLDFASSSSVDATTDVEGTGGVTFPILSGAVAGGVGDETRMTPSDTKYMEVHHGGRFGHGGDSFYVPFAAVQLVEVNGAIILRYSVARVTELFSEPPKPDESEVN